jgi:hypothetical protein
MPIDLCAGLILLSRERRCSFHVRYGFPKETYAQQFKDPNFKRHNGIDANIGAFDVMRNIVSESRSTARSRASPFTRSTTSQTAAAMRCFSSQTSR